MLGETQARAKPSHHSQHSLQSCSELLEDEANDTQGMQEGRESRQGVSKEIQGEQKGMVAFPSELPLAVQGGWRAEGLRAPGAGGAQQATDPTALCFGELCCFHRGSGWSSASLSLLVFQFEGNITVLTQMMVDPATTEKRGGGKNLPLRRGEILDVIQFTNKEQILCRNSQRRCKSAAAPHSALLLRDPSSTPGAALLPSSPPCGCTAHTRFSPLCCRRLCAPGCDAAPVSIPSPALPPSTNSPLAQTPPAAALTGGCREMCPTSAGGAQGAEMEQSSSRAAPS